MSAKISACLFSIVLQTIAGQYIGNHYNGLYGNGLVENGLPNGFGYGPQLGNPLLYEQGVPNTMFPASGGTFTVRSSSAIPPTGVTVQSENLVIEGPVAVTGKMPFLGVVALEGPLPTAGEGSIAYGCGNGNIGIVSENEIGHAHVNAGINPAGLPIANNIQRLY